MDLILTELVDTIAQLAEIAEIDATDQDDEIQRHWLIGASFAYDNCYELIQTFIESRSLGPAPTIPGMN